MISDAQVIQVHSIAEAYLTLMASHCKRCAKGPLKQQGGLTRTDASPGGWALATKCAVCGGEGSIDFAIDPAPTRERARSDQINPTPQRSNAIDLLGWLTLFQTILAKSQEQDDKQSGRQLAYEAAQCLDEALKFYDGENELPGEEAFFAEASRRRFRDHPQQFARSKWRQRRLMLPDVKATTRPPHERVTRRWWQIWRRDRP